MRLTADMNKILHKSVWTIVNFITALFASSILLMLFVCKDVPDCWHYLKLQPVSFWYFFVSRSFTVPMVCFVFMLLISETWFKREKPAGFLYYTLAVSGSVLFVETLVYMVQSDVAVIMYPVVLAVLSVLRCKEDARTRFVANAPGTVMIIGIVCYFGSVAGNEIGLVFWGMGFCIIFPLLIWKLFRFPDAGIKKTGWIFVMCIFFMILGSEWNPNRSGHPRLEEYDVWNDEYIARHTDYFLDVRIYWIMLHFKSIHECYVHSLMFNNPVTDEFLKLGIPVDIAGNEGMTGLHYAAQKKNPAGIRKLLDAGVDVNIQDASGRTALHIASSLNDLTTVKLLLYYDALVNIRDSEGNTPVIMAVKENLNFRELENLLLAAGADMAIADKQGKNAYAYASENPVMNVLPEILLEKMGDQNIEGLVRFIKTQVHDPLQETIIFLKMLGYCTDKWKYANWLKYELLDKPLKYVPDRVLFEAMKIVSDDAAGICGSIRVLLYSRNKDRLVFGNSLPPLILKYCRDALKSSDSEQRLSAIKLLGEAQCPESRDILRSILRDGLHPDLAEGKSEIGSLEAEYACCAEQMLNHRDIESIDLLLERIKTVSWEYYDTYDRVLQNLIRIRKERGW